MFQPTYVRALTGEESEALRQRAYSSNEDESWRARVILLSAEGRTAAEIARQLGFHASNVKKWIRKFNEEGLPGIALKKRGPQGGPRPHFTQNQIEEILQLTATEPSVFGYSFKDWTPQKLAIVAIERGIVERISHVTVRQLLRRRDDVSGNGVDGAPGRRGSNTITDSRAEESEFRLGRRALAVSDYETAVRHLYSALEREGQPPEDEATIRALLSRALEELSRYDEAYAVVEKYEDPHNLAGLPTRARARMKLCTGWANSWLGNYPKAIASQNEAMRLFLELQDTQGVSEAHYALGRTYTEINEFRIARDHLLAAAKGTTDRDLLARVYNKLGIVDHYEGAFTSAKEHYLKALELAEGSTEYNLLGVILLNVGATTYYPGTLGEGRPGESEKSTRYLKRAIEYLEKGGHKDALALAHNNLGDNLRYQGLWDEAVDNLHKAVEIAQRFKQPNLEATARITLAEILCGRGQYAEAETHLNKSLAIIEGSGDKWLEGNALRIMANVQMGEGKGEAAVKTLRTALQLSTSIGDLHGVSLAQVGLAEYHFSKGGHEQAREYLELAQGRLKEEKYLLVTGLIQRLMGQLESAAGRFAQAKQHLAQSISIFTTTEIQFELARSYYEMGNLLANAYDLKGAETNLIQAKQTFENLRADPYIRLMETALGDLAEGGERAARSIRVTPPSDVLLMQRLIEASASRELLVRELAAVLYENFPVDCVLICDLVEADQRSPVAFQGLTAAEADRLCARIDPTSIEATNRNGDYGIIIGDGLKAPVLLYTRSRDEKLDMDRLSPFFKQAELGLEACSLRANARTTLPSYEVAHRVQTIMPGFIIGSTPMFNVIDKIHKIRTSGVTCLITGESGTGKELVARAIHKESARAHNIFLPFNCTATPKEIIDSQLFGHRRGAFTGATTNYPGVIRAADGGTLFLDEIGDLSLEVQPKLMRFLQEGEIQPLGETKPIKVDVRVLAATNSDLERAVEDGRFREDLFHRLNIIRIHVPPLRDRRQEVPVLAGHFLEHFASRSGKTGLALNQEAIDALTDYDWPGNVRQLRNEIERVVAYASDGEQIATDDLSPDVARPRRLGGGRLDGSSTYSHRSSARPITQFNGDRSKYQGSGAHSTKLKDATRALERQLIEDALVRNRNNLSRTAIDLGLSRRGLRLKLDQLGIARQLS